MKHIIAMIRRSIAFKQFVSLMLVLILPLSTCLLIFNHRLSDDLISFQTRKLVEKAELCSNILHSTIVEMQDAVTSLILNNDFQEILKSSTHMPTYSWFQEHTSMLRLLSTITVSSGSKYSVHVLCPNDKLYSSDGSYDTMKTDSTFIQRLRGSGGAYTLINHRLEKIDYRNVISLGRMIQQTEGEPSFVWVDVSPAALTSALRLDDDATMFYICSGDRTLFFQGTDAFDLEEVQEQLNQLVRSGKRDVELLGKEFLLISCDSGVMDCQIGVLLDKEVAFSETNALLFSNLIYVLCILLVCIVVCLLQSNGISLRIRRLQHAISAFVQEPARQSAKLRVTSPDELGQLTRDFNNMAAYISDLLCQKEVSEQQKRRLEFQFLQAQINPHMIYNTLHSISYLAQLQNATNADELCQSLARLLKRVFSLQDRLITVHEEVACLQDYVTIKMYTLPWAIDIDFRVQPETERLPILKLLLQPLIENAFAHAFSAEYPTGHIRVAIRQEDRLVEVRVSDNGQGMSRKRLGEVMRGPSDKSGFSGVGLRNVLERFEIEYGKRCEWFIHSRPGQGTVILLRYPVLSLNKEAT